MLEKAEWNYAQFKADPTNYRLADFFVSASHVEDYLKATLKKSNPNLGQAIKDYCKKEPDFRFCKDLCNVAKHYELDPNHKPSRVNPTTFTLTSEILGAEIGALEICASDKWVMTTVEEEKHSGMTIRKNHEIDVTDLANRVMLKWRELFAQHGL